MSSKQLTLSADNLLTLQMDACLTLSSSVPSGLCSPVSPSSSAAAADADSKPVGQKRRVSSSECDDIERQSCLAAGSVESEQTLCHELADVRSDSDAADNKPLSSRDSTSPLNQQVMIKLPRRSRSNITRKKAFYNVKRPLSIVRRDSSSSTSDDCVNL